MAGKRTVEPQLWQKPDFLRASYIAREVWLGMICACADDEGRLEADPWGLAEKLFSRSHDATEEDVAEALRYWQRVGWLTLYGEDDRYGFLNGWYEHQYIRRPEPSSYPPPPVLISSWRSVQQVKSWYMSECGGMDNTHLRTMLRDFAQAVSGNSELSTQVLCSESVDTAALKGKGKGKEREREREKGEGERVRLLAQYEDRDRALVEGFLANCADENTTKRITTSRAVSEIVALEELRLTLIAEDEANGEERWRYGLAQSNRAGAPNINYVAKAARNWKRASATTGQYSPTPSATRPIGPTDNAKFGQARRAAQ